jgi:MFS family permease
MSPPPAVSIATAGAAPADIGGLTSRERYTGLIWLVSAAFFMQALDSTIVNTAVPAIASALNETPLNMRSALTSYVLTLAILIPASPWLCDRFGTRRVFGVAISTFAVGSLLCGISPNWSWRVCCKVAVARR